MAEERVESQGFFEMLWDCDHCGTKGLLAHSQRHCPECGAKQNPATRHFPSAGEAVRVAGHAYEGADRTCASCGAAQGARAHNCTQCGAPLDGAQEVKGVAAARPAPAPRKRRWWLTALVIALIALAIFGIWYRFIRKREARLTVAAHQWERVVPVEEYREITLEAWRDQPPAGGERLGCRDKERSSRRVEDGETCHDEKVDRKDGTFEVVKKCVPKYRSEPVLDAWCSYRAQRWVEVPEAAARAQGTGLEPKTPASGPPPGAPPILGARRSVAPRTTLTLVLGDQRCEVSEAVWRKYKDGQAVTVEVRASSGAIVCSSL